MTAKYGIYFHFLCKQGGYTPLVLNGGGGGCLDVTLMVLIGSSREVQYFIYFTFCTMIDITVLVKVLYMYIVMRYMC